jgi:hypothetical protein
MARIVINVAAMDSKLLPIPIGEDESISQLFMNIRFLAPELALVRNNIALYKLPPDVPLPPDDNLVDFPSLLTKVNEGHCTKLSFADFINKHFTSSINHRCLHVLVVPERLRKFWWRP